MKRVRIILCGSLWLLLSVTVSAQRPFTTQIAALSSQNEAEEKVRELKSQGLDAYWIKSNVPGAGVRYRIRIGRFSTRAAAQSQGEKLRRSGLIENYFIAEYEAPPRAAQPPAQPDTRTAASNAAATPASRPRLSEPAVVPTLKPTPKPTPATISERVTPTVLKNDEATSGPAASEPVPATSPGSTIKAGKPAITKPGKPVNPGFLSFQDPAIGYSFEHPASWSGAAWSDAERMAQNVDGGASFKSLEDNAFLNVIWNRLPGANDPKKYDNTLLVDTIVKSMGSGADTQTLNELSRQVEAEDGQIRTRLDLNALFRNPQTAAPLNFLGKAIITRCPQGILLVVVFYSQDAPPAAAINAERMIRSVRAPQ